MLRTIKSKKGIASSMMTVVLILIAVGVVGYIIYEGMNGSRLMLKGLFSKYEPPRLNSSTAFQYSITDFSISEESAARCTLVEGKTNEYICRSGQYVDFLENIRNGGSSMKKITGATMVCKTECKRGTCEPKDCPDTMTKTGNACNVIPDKDGLECEAGSHQFAPGKYIVYPGAICSLDQTTGCYEPGMMEADSIIEQSKFLIISVV